MVPARVMRAAERFRAVNGGLPAPNVYVDYVNYHDAIHMFVGAPPTDAGEDLALEVELTLRGIGNKQYQARMGYSGRIEMFQKRYGHLFAGMLAT